MNWIIIWLLSSVALLITSYLVPGFAVKSFGAALIAALIIGVLNVVMRPILIFLTLPINILTLGLFTFVINAAVLMLTSKMIEGFAIKNWTSAIIAAIVLAIVNMVLL